MKRSLSTLFFLLLAYVARADVVRPGLSRALADALYCKVAGDCTVQNFTITGTCTGCGGTVTSVGNGTIGGLFTVSWATVTTTPALSLNFATQSANCILSGPTSGAPAVPTCRAMVDADLGSFSLNASFKTITVQPVTDVITATFRRDGAAQTSNITEWQTEGNALLAAVDKTGAGAFLALKATGTAGAGFVEYPAQSSPPSAPATGLRKFADSTGRMSWIRASDGFIRTWDATLSANRVYTLPDAATNIPIIPQTITVSGPTAARTWTVNDVAGTIPLMTTSGSTTTVAHGSPAGAGTFGPVVDADTSFTAPALGAPTATTIQISGNVGLGLTLSGTAGNWINAGSAADQADLIVLSNANAAGTTARAGILVSGSNSTFGVFAHSAGRTISRLGHAIGGYDEWTLASGNGLMIDTQTATPIEIGTSGLLALTIDSTQNIIVAGPSLQNTAVKTLTESSATAFVAITVANSSACSGYVDYTVFAADATNTQAKSGQLFFSTVANSSGTVTKAAISDVNTLNPVSSGTLTNTMTDTTGANTYTLLANAVSSLTQTTLNIKYLVHITSGTCTVTAQ